MKDKIVARLRALFSGLNLSNARLDAIADKLAPKITDENQIDTRLNELNEISPFSDLARFDDWQRSKEQKEKQDKEKADKEKADKEKADRDKQQQQQQGGNSQDPPEWAKTLIDQNKQMAQKIEELETGKRAESHQSKLMGILTDKKVPESYYGMAVSGRTFKDDAEVTTFANSLVEAYGKFHQGQVDTSLEQTPKPVIGSGKDASKEVSSEMTDYLKDRKTAQQQQQPAKV